MTATSIAPLFHSQAPPRPGRLSGVRSQVFASARTLGIHHFAFLRAVLIGVDPDDAFDRYLAWSEATTDLRHTTAPSYSRRSSGPAIVSKLYTDQRPS